jgi:RND family efflux transporter MFP subunit
MKLQKRTLIIAIVVGIFVAIAGFRIISRLVKNADQGNLGQQALYIRVDKVVKGSVVDQVKISGTIRPVNEVELFPKIAGRIIAVNREVGDQVKKGDVLAVIEHREISLQEQAAKAALNIARTNENAAKIEYDRAKILFEENAMAKAQLESFEQKYAVARAQTLSAKAEADLRNQQSINAQVTSLIDGTITKRTAALGASVSPSSPVFTVQDISSLKLVTSVDASTLTRLKKGIWANLAIDQTPPLSVSGKVITLAPSLDLNSRRAQVEIEIDDDSGLVPNMFIDGALILNELKDVLTIPNAAIISLENKPAVFRIIDNKAYLVNPQLGASDRINTVVIEGLNEGDVVATSSLERLHEGANVTVEEMAK